MEKEPSKNTNTNDMVSRRTFLRRGSRAALGGAVTWIVLPLVSGCGGSSSGGGSDVSGFDTPDIVQYVARLTPAATQHYDADSGSAVNGVPTCQCSLPPSADDLMTYGVVFEGNDQSAFAGSTPSTFVPSNGTATTPPDQPQPAVRHPLSPKDDDQFGFSFFNFFYVRGGRLEEHPLTPCVNANVLHTHLTIKRSKDTPDKDAYFKFHLGVYRDGANRCYVLYDNLHKSICIKLCFPYDGSSGVAELQSVFHDALAAGFATLAIYVADWVITAAAEVLATATIGILIAL